MAKRTKTHWARTTKGRAAIAAHMRTYWAQRKANGHEKVTKEISDQIATMKRDHVLHAKAFTEKAVRRVPVDGRIGARRMQELAVQGARVQLEQLDKDRAMLQEFIKRGGQW